MDKVYKKEETGEVAKKRHERWSMEKERKEVVTEQIQERGERK